MCIGNEWDVSESQMRWPLLFLKASACKPASCIDRHGISAAELIRAEDALLSFYLHFLFFIFYVLLTLPTS